MDSANAVLAHDWLGICRRSVSGLREILAAAPTTAERVIETGTRGAGGDRTLAIDAAAEDLVFAELERLHDGGVRFTAVSEERGIVDFGDPGVLVVIDPIDGSLNAKRGLLHYAVSVAVASGPRMQDVVFGFVADLEQDEEWVATRGRGAQLNGVELLAPSDERRTAEGLLEIVAVESASPANLAACSDGLMRTTHRVRALGTIAVSLCQVAAGRADAMASLRSCRSVDVAAAQLIVRESGGQVAFPGLDDPAGPPLAELAATWPVVAARSTSGLQQAALIPVRR